MPALSAVVYKSVKPIAGLEGGAADLVGQAEAVGGDQLPDAGVGRVSGSSFNEVTFYAKVGGGGWKSIGTDDTRPYRVFHDVSAVTTTAARSPTAPWCGTTPDTSG